MRRDLAQQFGFGRRMHDDAVDERHRAQLEPAQLLGLLPQLRVVFQLGLALRPQEVQVGDAVQDARLRKMLPHHAGVFRGVRIAVQVDQVDRHLQLAEHVFDRHVERVVQALDAAALQVGGIGIDPGHVVARDEGQLVAEPLQRQHVLQRGVRPGILVRLGHGIVDEQRALLDRALGFQLRQLAVEAVARQRLLPALEEFAVVDRLVALHAAAGRAGAGAGALEMHDLRRRAARPRGSPPRGRGSTARCPRNSPARNARRTCRAWRTAPPGPSAPRPRRNRCRADSSTADRPPLAAAPVPAVAEPPDDAAAFLQGAVGIEQLRAGNADLRVAAASSRTARRASPC